MDEIYSKMFFMQLSIWFYNRGQKQYHSIVRHRTLLHEQLKLAGAARGLPGDHGHAYRSFLAFQYVLPPTRQTSGHEPCRASRNRSHHVQSFCSLSPQTCSSFLSVVIGLSSPLLILLQRCCGRVARYGPHSASLKIYMYISIICDRYYQCKWKSDGDLPSGTA